MDSQMIREIPLGDIQIGEVNVRKHSRDKGIEELAASIQAVGLLQPVVLRGTFGKPRYDLIVGQRRYLAHQSLGRPSIRAIFEDPQMSDTDALIRSLTENAQRVELNHADAAEAVTRLYNEFGRDDRKVAQVSGLSLQMVRKYLDVKERASERMLELLRGDRGVTLQDVRRCLDAALDDIGKAEELLELMAGQQLTKYQKDRVVQYGRTDASLDAEEILEQAKAPAIEERVAVRLAPGTRQGLERAVKELAMDIEMIAEEALQDWLRAKGFMDG